ncbi:MAG: ABC transporter permease [Porticoccaceae bacterium]|jgi:lipopolysaccharide transport system permease protein|nr:ABC transporter permease [Porticoccaceae bacterium]
MSPALLLHFVRQDLVDRHAASALGALWTLLIPLANILIFTLVFSRLMGARLEMLGMQSLGAYSYSVYLVTGLLAWTCFANTLSRIGQVFHEKAGLIGKVKVSLFTLPLYVLISELVIYGISMSFFVAFLLLIDFQLSWHWLWLPIILAVQQLLAYSLGLIVAVLSVFLRDIRELVTLAVQFWFWLTPIVYVMTILPDKWLWLFKLNPLYHTTAAMREALIIGATPDLLTLGIIAMLGMGLLMGGLFIGKKLERDIRDFL